MSLALSLAAFLLVAIGLAHSYLGERYLLVRLLRRVDLPRLLGSVEFTAQVLRFAWHITTLAWWGFAAILLHLARGPLSARVVAALIGLTFVATGLVALVGSRGRHLSWPIFLLIGALALWAGAR